MEVTIRTEYLHALAHLAGQKDVREYLNGVWLEASRSTIAVSTDGCMLGAIDTGIEASARFDVLVPNEALAGMKKWRGIVAVRSADQGKTWTATCGTASIGWTPKDLQLIDWRRAVPKRTSAAGAMYDVRLVAKLDKVRAALGAPVGKNGGVLIHPSGPGMGPKRSAGEMAALVEIVGCPQFIGVLMPLNALSSECTALEPHRPPAWALAGYRHEEPLLQIAPATSPECDLV